MQWGAGVEVLVSAGGAEDSRRELNRSIARAIEC